MEASRSKMRWTTRKVVCELAWSEIHDAVCKKINQEFDAYQGRMQRMTGSQVYAHAEEITAMNFCYNQLLENFHDYQEKDLEPLLEDDQPLDHPVVGKALERLVIFQERLQVFLLVVVEVFQKLIVAEIYRGDFLGMGIDLTAVHALHTFLVRMKPLVDLFEDLIVDR